MSNTPEKNKPWFDEPSGTWNVLVVGFEGTPLHETITEAHIRARNLIAKEGVRPATAALWPNVPIALYDIPEERHYHYREALDGDVPALPTAPADGPTGLVSVA